MGVVDTVRMCERERDRDSRAELNQAAEKQPIFCFPFFSVVCFFPFAKARTKKISIHISLSSVLLSCIGFKKPKYHLLSVINKTN